MAVATALMVSTHNSRSGTSLYIYACMCMLKRVALPHVHAGANALLTAELAHELLLQSWRRCWHAMRMRAR